MLINPPFNIPKANYDSSISVGLLCLGSYLDHHGSKVVIIDGARQENWSELLDREVPDSLVVGLSVMTTQVAKALEISKKIKDLNPKAKIVWGGVHATLFPEQTIEHELIDYLIVGEGEEALLRLVKFLDRVAKRQEIFSDDRARFGTEEDFDELKKIHNLVFKFNGQIYQNSQGPFLDMDKMPQVNWDLIDQKVLSDLSLIPTHTSRGCPHRCAFCINAITCNKWRGKSSDKVIEDLKNIVSKDYFQGKPIRFWDEDFFALRGRSHEIVKGIIKLNQELPRDRQIKWTNLTTALPWETTVRADYFRDNMINDEFLHDLQQSGCYLLSFGAESGSPKILQKLTKDITGEQILNSARQCLRYQIIPQYSFMIGLPGEEREDMKKTMHLIDDLASLSSKIQILGPQAFRPYPGSKLYDECVSAGWQEPKTLEDWADLAKNELNYLNPHKFPWIKKENKDLVDSLEAYVRFGAHSINSALGSSVKSNKLIKLIFVLICHLRWQLKFFKWPIEYKLAKKFVSSLNQG